MDIKLYLIGSTVLTTTWVGGMVVLLAAAM